jgi:hypothetical protein
MRDEGRGRLPKLKRLSWVSRRIPSGTLRACASSGKILTAQLHYQGFPKARLLSKALFRLFLALSLLLSQAGAFEHAVSHWQQDNAPAKHTPQACAKCLAYAETCSGLKSAHFLVLAPAAHSLPSCAPQQGVSASPFFSYCSRAPPRNS